MSDDICVSIIIPSFNKGLFIEETLNSIITQNYNNIELIVIDAQSKDNTHEILARYKSEITNCVIEPDKGQSDAINKGVQIAKGEIVGWLNADDLLFPNAMESIVNGFMSNPDLSVVYGSGEKVDIDGNTLKDIPYRPFDRKLLKQIFYILQPSMYFRRNSFLKVGGLNTDSHLAMDWELVLKLSRLSNFHSIPDKIAKLRMYEGTKTSYGGWETYREIARIGKAQNGIADVNYLAYSMRNAVSHIEIPGIKSLIRLTVDRICGLMAGGKDYMVCRWPEYFQDKY